MQRRHESQTNLRSKNKEEENGKQKKDSSLQSVGKIKREIRNVKRLMSRVEVGSVFFSESFIFETTL